MEIDGDQGNDEHSVIKCAEEYTEYLDIESIPACIDKESDMDASIEAVLTRLEEFFGMLDMMRADSTKVTDEVLQNFRAERDRMKLIYKKIDDLEKFIEVVKHDCDSVERRVKETEAEFGTMNTIKKALGGMRLNFWEKKDATPSTKQQKVDYHPPTIFKTSDFILTKSENPD